MPEVNPDAGTARMAVHLAAIAIRGVRHIVTAVPHTGENGETSVIFITENGSKFKLTLSEIHEPSHSQG